MSHACTRRSGAQSRWLECADRAWIPLGRTRPSPFPALPRCAANISAQILRIRRAGFRAHPTVRDQLFFQQTRLEAIKSGRHGSMGGKNIATHGHLPRQAIIHFVAVHELPDTLYGKERGVPLVDVTYGWIETERFERAHAADAKDHFLP